MSRRPFSALSALIVAPLATAQWTETFVPYVTGTQPYGEGEGPFLRNNPKRQHLHIAQTPSTEPTPVYFFAHGNGGTAAGSPVAGWAPELSIVQAAGYSVISWESVTTLDAPEDTDVCWADAALVFEWFRANAAIYNLDPNKVIIGGRSRGSVCSWSLAQTPDPAIQGMYFYNSLPDRTWLVPDPPWKPLVTKDSPPAYLAYGPLCPKPIIAEGPQACAPVPYDGHNPKNGQKIVERYAEVGLSASITLKDGFESLGYGLFDEFPGFIDFLSSNSSSADGGPTPTGQPTLLH
jgi:acetyl esterase/lipase